MSSPLAANIADAAALADELARFRVVDSARLNQLLSGFVGRGAKVLADYLVQRGVLTTFQAGQALAGESRLLALGPYRLHGIAGQGTFGPLFTASHVSKFGTFAIRVLPLRSLWKAKQAKQLARTLSAGVNHSAVVQLLEVDSANGFHYLVWQHAEGEPLTDRVTATGSLAPKDTATMLAHLANAMSACHARGVFHGAITPYSVTLAKDGTPRLMELGAGALLAQNVADDESVFDSMSTAMASANVLTFAAPEVAANPQELTAAADQYALAAVGYFALTGLSPYPHPTLSEQIRAKRVGAPPSAAVVNPVVPTELADVLERMMSPSPAARFATLAEAEQQFTHLANTELPMASELISAVPFSQLRDAHKAAKSSIWTTNTPTPRPAERDDSDASITFELPDAPEAFAEEIPDQAPVNRASLETPPDYLTVTPSDHPYAEPLLPAPAPVLWHPLEPRTLESRADSELDDADSIPPSNSVLWKKVRRNLMFWQPATDVVQVSVFGPIATPGETINLLVFLHTPDATANVRTLSRAFLHEGELIGTGYLAREIPRAAEVAVHLSVANAGVAKSQFTFPWRGQPHRLNFDLHVPWESPEGVSPGLVSVGVSDVRVGKIAFHLHVLARKA